MAPGPTGRRAASERSVEAEAFNLFVHRFVSWQERNVSLELSTLAVRSSRAKGADPCDGDAAARDDDVLARLRQGDQRQPASPLPRSL